ncbi:hypothetical protein EVAR_78819_1 [Eumeta japonica]|uniref:Uncharacterized protein n=1 Tax=Eumeta variegata TaxID=151549 RepID=A0A4C1T1F4_EUMVA|nr:hypothetical protein EVAR_78819_1 [Eumeta japonica]
MRYNMCKSNFKEKVADLSGLSIGVGRLTQFEHRSLPVNKWQSGAVAAACSGSSRGQWVRYPIEYALFTALSESACHFSAVKFALCALRFSSASDRQLRNISAGRYVRGACTLRMLFYRELLIRE